MYLWQTAGLDLMQSFQMFLVLLAIVLSFLSYCKHPPTGPVPVWCACVCVCVFLDAGGVRDESSV